MPFSPAPPSQPLSRSNSTMRLVRIYSISLFPTCYQLLQLRKKPSTRPAGPPPNIPGHLRDPFGTHFGPPFSTRTCRSKSPQLLPLEPLALQNPSGSHPALFFSHPLPLPRFAESSPTPLAVSHSDAPNRAITERTQFPHPPSILQIICTTKATAALQFQTLRAERTHFPSAVPLSCTRLQTWHQFPVPIPLPP
jgi:hypothetical protein